MMSLTKEQAEQTRARCEAATSGPWDSTVSERFVKYIATDTLICQMCKESGNIHNDVEFIVHARQDIPALLDELDAAEKQVLISEDMINTNIKSANRMCADLKADRDHWRALADELGGYRLPVKVNWSDFAPACPKCGWSAICDPQPKYCPDCGQRLDWKR
jgi:hypothetical protein